MRFELTQQPSGLEKQTGHNLPDLERHLGLLPYAGQFQLWMFKADGESACLLCNEARAWLSIIPKAGEDLLSLDSRFVGAKTKVESIFLENGQLDEMPRQHCISRAEGIRAAIYYFREGVRAPFISWFPERAEQT